MNRKEVFVISYLSDGETDLIGVATSPAIAEEMIHQYFGEGAEYSNHRDIRERGLEFDMMVKDPGPLGGEGRVVVSYHFLNDI